MITLQRKKLKCTYGDHIFPEVPCRHLLAVATKQEEIDFDSLPFNKVWKKNYDKDEPEPERAFPKEEEKVQERGEKTDESNLIHEEE